MKRMATIPEVVDINAHVVFSLLTATLRNGELSNLGHSRRPFILPWSVTAVGSASFGSLRFDGGRDLVQRETIEPLAALVGVVAGARMQLAQKAQGVHNSQFTN